MCWSDALKLDLRINCRPYHIYSLVLSQDAIMKHWWIIENLYTLYSHFWTSYDVSLAILLIIWPNEVITTPSSFNNFNTRSLLKKGKRRLQVWGGGGLYFIQPRKHAQKIVFKNKQANLLIHTYHNVNMPLAWWYIDECIYNQTNNSCTIVTIWWLCVLYDSSL